MFYKYAVYYHGRLMGYVNALSENSALDKGGVLVEQLTGVRRSASRYSGLDTNNITVERYSY
jgi:hypothetical protein